PGVRGGAPSAGEPLQDLTAGERHYFDEGKDAFEEIAFVTTPPPGGDLGLGPGFNGNSCVSCHSFPATGGTSPPVNPLFDMANAMGARNNMPSFIKPDGPALEVRFKNKPDGTPDGGVHNLFVITGRLDARGCRMPQEDFSNTDNLSFRI